MTRTQTANRPRGTALVFALAVAWGTAARAGSDVVASKTYTVQPGGPRGGEAGAEYLNIEGKANGKYASFGVLAFPAPKPGPATVRVKGLTLTLVQSIPRFAKDGKVRFYLTAAADDPSGLKFDEKSADGLGGQLKDRHPLGAGAFKKVETGHVDTFTLTLDDATRGLLQTRLKDGGEIRLLIVPDDEQVAATYFGAGAEEGTRRPRLTLDGETP
jgi:hypothetical protein